MKQSKYKHYSIEEKRELLKVSALMFDHDVEKIASVCDKMPFEQLKKLAKIIIFWSKGKKRQT